MVSIRLAAKTLIALALCCRATAEEIDIIELDSPAKNAAYLSTSDIVVSGRSTSFSLRGTVKVLSANGTAQHAKGDFRVGAREENGKWASRIASPEHRGWRPRAHRVQVTIEGRKFDIPITIVPDLIGAGVPMPVATTAVDSAEYLKLPAVKMEAVTLSDPEVNPSKLIPDARPDDNGTMLDGTDEFAVEGTIRFQKPDGVKSLDIILRLTESQADRGTATGNEVIIRESLVLSEPTDDRAVFRYRTVLRAPNRPGKFVLEAIYRHRVIAASAIEVRRAAVEEDGSGRIIEYPPADAIYATTSHIVVAGRGRPARSALTVEMHDTRDVIHQSAGVTTGGPFHDGAWALQLPLPRGSVWRAGKYQIDVCPVYGRQISFPIMLIGEQAKPEIPPEELTKIESKAYDALPCLVLPDVILSNPDSATPEVTVGRHARDAIFSIRAGEEFSCECTLTFQDDGTFVPSDVIVRLTRDSQKLDDPSLTVDETIAKYKLTAQGRPDRFRSVLRVSNVPGRLKLDAIYRKAVIASAAIEVVPSTD
jgi:hypothetical protein